MDPEGFATRLIDGCWTPQHRIGLLTTTLFDLRMKHDAVVEKRPSRHQQFDDRTSQILASLHSGESTVEQAAETARGSEFSDSILIANSKQQMIEYVRQAVARGDNVWVDCSPNERILFLRFWQDESHQRIE